MPLNVKNPCNTRFYITEKGYEGVRNFQYKGGSSSILYAHLWSPLCNWIVDNIIPSNLAPNTITAFASIQYIITHLAIMYYSPDFQSKIPTGLIIWAAISTLVYQILDNCDGKQARKTGSSSPLGMLFDHGCDSCITWVMCLTVVNVLGLGQNTFSYFSVIVISQISFYMAQWSQYHVGVFKLGYVNAVDEGLVLVEGILLVTGILGQEFWQNKIGFLGDMPYNQAIIAFTLINAIAQIIIFIHDTTSEINGTHIVKSLYSVMYLLLCYALVYFLVPYPYIQLNGLYVHYAFAALFSKVTLQIQLAHLTKEEFKQMTFSFVFVTLFFIISLAITQNANLSTMVSTNVLLVITVVMALFAYMHMAVCVSIHISEILGISVFSIKKPEQKTFQPFSNELQVQNTDQIESQL